MTRGLPENRDVRLISKKQVALRRGCSEKTVDRIMAAGLARELKEAG